MDLDKMVDAVTQEIMRRLNGQGAARVVVFGDVPDGLLAGGYDVTKGREYADVAGCDYIVMTAASFAQFHGGAAAPTAPAAEECCCCEGAMIDLTGKRLIHERDLRDHNAKNGDVVKVAGNAIITALAHDYAKGHGIKFSKG